MIFLRWIQYLMVGVSALAVLWLFVMVTVVWPLQDRRNRVR